LGCSDFTIHSDHPKQPSVPRSSKAPPKRRRTRGVNPQQHPIKPVETSHPPGVPRKATKYPFPAMDVSGHPECVRKVLLKKLMGNGRLLDKMLKLVRSSSYEKFELTARGILMGAFEAHSGHDNSEEQTRIIHLTAVLAILEEVERRSAVVAAG
ncbi:hypothetical protein FOL47_008646, partial [Perkinsus chesapeaki]